MIGPMTIKRARRELKIAEGNFERAAKAVGDGHGGSPLEFWSEEIDEARTTLNRLLAERKRKLRRTSTTAKR